jgi:thiamine biosynthesis protein ThiS
MDLVVNGEKRTLTLRDENANVDAVVVALGLPQERVAVELNGAIVTKALRARTAVKDGDVLEVVTLVGGG